MSKRNPRYRFEVITLLGILTISLLSACQRIRPVPDETNLQAVEVCSQQMSKDVVATLNSLEQVDSFPLYTMKYQADYDAGGTIIGQIPEFTSGHAWACSLFAVFSNPDQILIGRNFDWDFSPALLLYTDPPGGFASVSIVDIHYLGFGEENAFGLTDLPLEDRVGLLDAPLIPFDGMNEAGLAVGMAAVPAREMLDDPTKATVDSLLVIRMVLDRAATVEQAVEIIKSYNITWGSGPPLHYLIADRSGQSVLVEYSRDGMVVIPNLESWQLATNFLVSEAGDSPQDQCWRYQIISRELAENEGQINVNEALDLLETVAQDSTQWSVVYDISSGEVNLVMGGEFEQAHHFKMDAEQ